MPEFLVTAILAEKGTIIIGGEYLNELVYKQLQFNYDFSNEQSAANDYNLYRGSISKHYEVYENLLQALNDSTHPFTSAFDGLKTVETIKKIYKAVNPLSQ